MSSKARTSECYRKRTRDLHNRCMWLFSNLNRLYDPSWKLFQTKKNLIFYTISVG